MLRYESRGGPAACLTKRIGSTYTASVFVNLYSLLCSIPAEGMLGKRVSVFSYGSGSASTMYHLECRGPVKNDHTVFDRLSARQHITVSLVPPPLSDLVIAADVFWLMLIRTGRTVPRDG